MTKRDVLYFLFRWKYTIFGWWLFIVALVAVLIYILPQSYLAESAVLVERTKAPLVTTQIARGGVFMAPAMDEAMNTELRIVLSRPVMEAVVDDLGLGTPPESSDSDADENDEQGTGISGTGDIFDSLGLISRPPVREAWIKTLLTEVAVKPLVDSNVLVISFGNTDPDLAMRVVNAITDSYIAHRRRIYSTSGASEYFRTKMEEAAQELESLRDELTAFKQRHSLSALEERRAELVREIGRTRDRLADLEGDLAELLGRFTENHPRVELVQHKIMASEDNLRDRARTLQELEQRAATTESRAVIIRSQEEVFLNYKARYEEERSREDTPENLVNARVIEYASLPRAPQKSRLFFIKVALVGGLLLAFLIAFFRQYFSHGVDRPEAVEQALGVPLLGSIAKTRAIQRY